MKKILFFLLMVLSGSLLAQNRELKITVQNKQGKPVKNVKIEVFTAKIKGSTDKNGVCTLENISEKDSLLISFSGSSVAGLFPVNGFSEMQFNTSRGELVAYNPVLEKWINGKSRKIVRKGEFDVEFEIKNGARNLEDLLKKMPSLMVTGGTVTLRNTIQTKEFTNNTPLIVIDNIVLRGGLEEANRVIDIHLIESIKVERDGILWGKDSVNGVILVKLKKQIP
ncbi:MAG: Plug domain-containing protein [Bacteroidales bacterium]